LSRFGFQVTECAGCEWFVFAAATSEAHATRDAADCISSEQSASFESASASHFFHCNAVGNSLLLSGINSDGHYPSFCISFLSVFSTVVIYTDHFLLKFQFF
jgi:hypothetical protein